MHSFAVVIQSSEYKYHAPAVRGMTPHHHIIITEKILGGRLTDGSRGYVEVHPESSWVMAMLD